MLPHSVANAVPPSGTPGLAGAGLWQYGSVGPTEEQPGPAAWAGAAVHSCTGRAGGEAQGFQQWLLLQVRWDWKGRDVQFTHAEDQGLEIHTETCGLSTGHLPQGRKKGRVKGEEGAWIEN